MRKRIIDNHTMKVFITRDDLKKNGITALDLLGDHNQIEKFFYKILNRVDTKHLFEVHEPLTFRIIPNKMGLNIIISCRANSMIIKNKSQKLNSTKPTSSKNSLNNNVIKLNNFENFVQISHVLKLQQGCSKLYHYQNHYYLELTFSNHLTKSQQDKIKDVLAIAYEYGSPATVSSAKLCAHGKLIMANHALEKGRYYFR